MTDQQFCLRWNNHQSTLVAVFDGLLEKGVLVDCTLAAEGQQLTAHKVVLAACSPFLETLLSRHYDKHPILILKDVKFSELKAMMDYMYRGEVNISQDQLGTFLKAAESLQIKGLSDGGGEKDGSSYPPPKRQQHERKPLRPTSPLRNSMPPVLPLSDGKRPPPPPFLHNNIRNSLKSSPLLVDIPEDSLMNRAGRDGSLSPVPRKKKRPRESSEEVQGNTPLNNNVLCKSEEESLHPLAPTTTTTQPATRPAPTCEQPAVAPRVPSPDLKPDEKTDPVAAHLKHELIEEEEDINDDSVELTLDEDDGGEAGPSHNDGDYSNDFYGASQDGDNRDGQARNWAQYLPYLTAKENAALDYERLIASGSIKAEDLLDMPKIHICPRCGRCYKIRSTLNRHIRYECGIARKKLACEICGKKFSRPDNLKQHEQTHVTIYFGGEGGPPGDLPPPTADAKVSTEDSATDHMTITPQIFLLDEPKTYMRGPSVPKLQNNLQNLPNLYKMSSTLPSQN